VHSSVDKTAVLVERTEANLGTARPHFCLGIRKFVGLEFRGVPRYLDELFCPWCGEIVPLREPGHYHDYALRPVSYEGPRCEHGYPDVPCTELYDTDLQLELALKYGNAIREFRAAMLARRYGIAPTVLQWIRACPHCRRQAAIQHKALLRHELEQIARALADENKAAARRVEDLRDDVRWFNVALAELNEQTKVRPQEYEPHGFVYLIGHKRAVKIGWSSKHPSKGRLSQLRSASFEPVELLGLLEGTPSRERELHGRFAGQRISGEWFIPHKDILAYFKKHGLQV
jgi:hypothetical protein